MMRQCGILISFLVLFRGYVEGSIPNDDVSIIRQRVLNWMLLPSKENISDTVHNALVFTHRLNSSCYWPDVTYNDTRMVHWLTAEHLSRITTMLQAIVVNDSTVQNDPQIRAAVHCALNVWLVNDWRAPNWYYNEIYVPILATGQLLMLGDNATSFETEKITEISYRAAWWYNKPRDASANIVWMIQAEIYRSLATNNLTGIAQGFSRMWADVAVQSADAVGVQSDWSYHFHGRQLLNGAYGMAWAQNIFAFIVCSQQTKYAANEQQFSTFIQFITKGSAWMTIRNDWDWHVRGCFGRASPVKGYGGGSKKLTKADVGVKKSQKIGGALPEQPLIGRAVSRPDKEYHVLFDTRFMRQMAESVPSNDTKNELINFADRLDGYSNASVLIGNKHYFISDYQIHHRKNWTSAIKMQSIRTQPIECNNDENIKAELSGQGVLNLYTGNTYDYDNIFPLLDWQAINGITVEHGIPLEPCTNASFLWQNVSFVGGVSDDQYGSAMMDTATHDLTAQRSWHFYDDAIIALATNLSLPATIAAWTTLASRLLRTGRLTIGFFNSTVLTLSDGNYSFPYVQDKTSNVQWIYVGGSDIGYLLPDQQQHYAALGLNLEIKQEIMILLVLSMSVYQHAC